MTRRAMISLLLAVLLALSPVCAAVGLCASKCKTCGNTGVCVKCEGDGECYSCYKASGYSSGCVACRDEIPGKCDWCYGGGMWVSPTGKIKTCPKCYGGGTCKYCNGTGLSSVECNICLTTGKCYNCGGDGGCPDCQFLDRNARVIRERLIANINGNKITIGEAEKILEDLEKQCKTCLGLGTCESCGGQGYERCPNRCKPSDGGCNYCDGDGYRDCSACGGSGQCQACGGDGQK